MSVMAAASEGRIGSWLSQVWSTWPVQRQTSLQLVYIILYRDLILYSSCDMCFTFRTPC